MQWCDVLNMWCSDTDEEDYAMACCNGHCSGCEECSEYEQEIMK